MKQVAFVALARDPHVRIRHASLPGGELEQHREDHIHTLSRLDMQAIAQGQLVVDLLQQVERRAMEDKAGFKP
ncbi:hypothetical protein D3C72_2358570 [compost metagenome]